MHHDSAMTTDHEPLDPDTTADAEAGLHESPNITIPPSGVPWPVPAMPADTVPGRTPGSAEGNADEPPEDALSEPGRTAGSAEGERETIEEDLRQKGAE